jgi:hypothetical protein
VRLTAGDEAVGFAAGFPVSSSLESSDLALGFAGAFGEAVSFPASGSSVTKFHAMQIASVFFTKIPLHCLCDE